MRFGYFASYIRADEDKSLTQVYRDTAEQVECADAAGFDVVWFPEHHFTHQYCAPNPLVNITDMAHRTRRVRLGTSVIVAPFHHPLVIAEEIGMVDHLVEGRLEIGFARGSSLYEYQRLGLTDVQAADRLRESLDILLGLWQADTEFAYRGNQFEFPATYVVPRPLQQPHPPLWVAARTPDTLRFCIERGIGLHTTPLRQPMSAVLTTMNIINAIVNEDAATVRPTVAVQTETCVSDDHERIMHAMQRLERNHVRAQNFTRDGNIPVRGFGSLDPLPEGLRITAEALSERGVVGDPDTCIGRIRRYQSLGAGEFIASMDFGQPQRDILRSIELFGSHVIPQCREPVPVEDGSQQPRAGATERRHALLAQGDRRFGSGWQEWQTSDWLAWFERRQNAGEAPPCEIFDFSVAPRNARADAAGVVGTSGRLILIRDQACPACGRPILALCYRQNAESPLHMRETVRRQQHWPAWHAAHP
jgi:alkanesulfonate monooxygenase SsuD/methylene tetrahydromethanopterin reductase-like flavin-dependent oxidoreductase (luciferase family)